jgi:uncharacterized protein involved in cysteine biosynthesis
MFASFTKAAGQLADPRLRRVLMRGLAATLVLYLVLYAVMGWGLTRLHLFGVGWVNGAVDILGGLAVFLITLMLFPSLATVCVSFFLEEAALAIEAKHYPGLPPPRKQTWTEIASGAARFALVALVVNLVALPVYIFLLVIGIGAGLYYVINGYLMAREYFELVAWRRLEPARADALRRANGGRLWLIGLVLAVLSTVPVVNLFVPIFSTMLMVHEFEALRRKAGFL